MNLVIDIGNTNSKLAVFKNSKLLDVDQFKTFELLKHYHLARAGYSDINRGIVSNVGTLETKTIDQISEQLPLHHLSYKSSLPFTNCYSTPKTLGVDRIALTSAALKEYPRSNVLIIDAGTCITYDFVDSNSNYFGGAISPGLRIRYESLHNFTANLPLLERSVPRHITGNSTEESIHSGVVIGICREIDGVIDTYRSEYPDLTVILTGGDSKFLLDQLKNSIFANSNFLLTGLNYLLDYNSQA